MMCSRMLIMFGGKILAADTPENLQRLMAGSSRIVAENRCANRRIAGAFCQAELPGVDNF